MKKQYFVLMLAAQGEGAILTASSPQHKRPTDEEVALTLQLYSNWYHIVQHEVREIEVDEEALLAGQLASLDKEEKKARAELEDRLNSIRAQRSRLLRLAGPVEHPDGTRTIEGEVDDDIPFDPSPNWKEPEGAKDGI